MGDLTLISKGLYRLVNMLLGSESVVHMRRMVMDLQHEIRNVACEFESACEAVHLSGSTREGLRFSTSDEDFMFIHGDIRVIFSLLQLPRYNNITVLLAECEGMRPGFALLRLVTGTSIPLVTELCVKYQNLYHLPSVSWRNCFVYRESESIHGPCTSGLLGNKEYDFAYCIKSDIWPDAALDCIRRLRQAGWPSQDVLSTIIKEGCLFVPIGSKYSPYEEYEWRLSFSLAERTLIHNMTHSQFLTYGLLKIFLKEAIDANAEVKGLLCSYFLKTILFWRVTQGTQCVEGNFLLHFWKCFEILIIYVIAGHCPNFFIPENNMFRSKIEGEAQRKLLSHLTTLYRTGYSCLLQCPSLQNFILPILQQPMIALNLPSDQTISTKSLIETHLIFEVLNSSISVDNDHRVNIASLLRMESLLSNSSSETASFVLKTWLKLFVQKLCVMLVKRQRDNTSRKTHYKMEQYYMKVIMLSSCDTAQHLVYAAIALYHSENFTRAIKLLQKAKRRLQHPCLMYPRNLNEDKYRAAGGETVPVGEMMKAVVARPVGLDLNACIPVLQLEHEAANQHWEVGIMFPPLVITGFLLFLCYHSQQNLEHSNMVLDELFTLVHYDDGYHIENRDRAPSWQLLGICQEMSGDYQGACYSYSAAMQQSWCHIRSACELRLRNVCSHIGTLH